MTTLTVIDLPEDPVDRGRQHGASTASMIKKNVATYRRRLAAGGLGDARTDELAAGWLERVGESAPEYYAEMQGIAEGAGVPLLTIALLNARYELSYAVFSTEADAEHAVGPDGCTSFAVTGEATSSGDLIVGQNWDWLNDIRGGTLITRVRRRNKPSFVGFTEAGIAGCKIGLNEAGIGLLINGLVTPQDGANRNARPVHVRCRDILDADRFDKAIEAVVSGKRTCSTNFLLAHAEGEVINIEATPNYCSYMYPQDGILTHANHLEEEKRVESLFEKLSPHTLYRSPRLRRLLKARRGEIDLDHVRRCLGDHFGWPVAICRHPDPEQAPERRTVTASSVVMDLRRAVLWATAGPVCEHEPMPFPLSDEKGQVSCAG